MLGLLRKAARKVNEFILDCVKSIELDKATKGYILVAVGLIGGTVCIAAGSNMIKEGLEINSLKHMMEVKQLQNAVDAL